MVGHTNLEDQVDADFADARRRALLRRMRTRQRSDNASDGLLCFDDLGKIPGAPARVYRGMRTVPVWQLGGSVGRCSEFDRDFMPAKASVEERWKRIDLAFHRGEQLPPVSLYKVGSFYFVLDGHHRVSVASYHGAEWVDAEVTEFRARPSKARVRADKQTRARRTEYAPNDTPPALEGHPRADGARRAAGGPQTAHWPEIGTGMGAKEARRTLPQASEDLMECRLGTGRHHLSAIEGLHRHAEPEITWKGALVLMSIQEEERDG